MNIKEKIDKYINDRGLLKTPAHYVKELFNDIISKVYDVEQKPENIILFDTNKLNIDTKNGYYCNENLLSSIKITMAGDIIQPKVEFNGLSPKIELPKNIAVNNKLINYDGIGKYVLSFNNNTCDIERYKCDFTKAPSGYIITTYYPEYLGDYPLSNNNYMFISLDRDYTTAYGPVMENEKFITYVGTSIEPGLFVNCAINSIEIPDSVKTIGEFAFAGSGITSVEMGNSVTSIGEGAFTYCDLLTSVEIPDSVTSIGYGAFAQCYELASITIPNSVTQIGEYAFADCYNLASVVWNPINYPDFEMDENWEELSNPFYYSIESITSFKFGDGVEHIPAFMCYGMHNLKSITIPNSVTSIGMGTFGYCSGLTSVVIPDSVTSIGEYAFESCSDLTSIVIPDSVTEIGCGAFYGTSWLQNQPDGCVYINNVLYVYKGEMSENTHIDVRGGTTMISDEAFYDCSGLTSIAIPNSVTSIGSNTFDYCSGLTSVAWDVVNYPDFSSNSDNPFYDIYDQITSFEFGDSVEHIPAYMCYDMSNLTSITIPDSVTSIGDYVFYGCSGLTSITIPDSVTSIGDYIFYQCSGLTSITLGNSITSIGQWVFYNVSAPIAIPNSVTIIGEYAFAGAGITSITIPDSVTSIGSQAFFYCTELTSVTMDSITPPSFGSSVFTGGSSELIIYVPDESVDTYKTAANWSSYADKIKPISEKPV